MIIAIGNPVGAHDVSPLIVPPRMDARNGLSAFGIVLPDDTNNEIADCGRGCGGLESIVENADLLEVESSNQ
jgi:hypothetical protein